MTNHTAQALLEAVGVKWREKYGVRICPECGCRVGHYYNCRRPSTRDDPYTYTGPALGSDELDALLLVAGQKWLRDCYLLGSYDHSDRVQSRWNAIAFDAFPGHALALAIAEVRG